MSNSSFVTVQRGRKRLMPAGIEDMLVDLTDVVTQIGLTSVVPRSLRERSTAGVIDGVLASTYASRTGQGLKQVQEWMVAGNMIRQRPKPSIARFADEQIADPNEPNAAFDPTRNHRGPPHGAGRVIVEEKITSPGLQVRRLRDPSSPCERENKLPSCGRWDGARTDGRRPGRAPLQAAGRSLGRRQPIPAHAFPRFCGPRRPRILARQTREAAPGASLPTPDMRASAIGAGTCWRQE